MKGFMTVVLAGIVLLSACDNASGILVRDAWARPAMMGGNGAVYFLLQNRSAGADELTGVSSDVAEAVEIHETRMEGDVMLMRPVTSIPIPGKGSLEFAPGGLHVMLIGLKQDLSTGDEIQVILEFANYGDVTVSVPVQEIQGGPSTNDH